MQPFVNLSQDEDLRSAIVASLLLALFTVLLMVLLLVPTMIWVRLRVPELSRVVEFLCLLPLTVPPLVIVVGITNVYTWVNYLLGDSAFVLDLRVRRAGAALLLPLDRLGPPGHRRDHAGRGRPLAGGRAGSR